MVAEQALAVAQYNLAVCYAVGIGVYKDEQQAVKYFQMAADQGHKAAIDGLIQYINKRGMREIIEIE
jgi:TPR repeat protein